MALALAWSAAYARIHPEDQVSVSEIDLGSAGPTLVQGAADIAEGHQPLTPTDVDALKRRAGGRVPQQVKVAFDAVCVYVNRANALDSISTDVLRQIFAEGGQYERWAQLGIKIRGARKDKISRVVVRPGTAADELFRTAVFGEKGTGKADSLAVAALPDLIALVASSPTTIGYASCGQAADVKGLAIVSATGARAVTAAATTIRDASYPLSRPLFLHAVGGAPERVQRYLEWLRTETPQKIAEKQGYISGSPQ